MPVKRRMAKQRRAEVPDRIREYFREEIQHTFFYDSSEISAAWDLTGQEIVEDWILTRPGTRPMIWWRLSAPEPGRTHDGGGGGPGRAPENLDIPIAAPAPTAQLDFLRRHDLLLPGELARLSNSDPPDEAA